MLHWQTETTLLAASGIGPTYTWVLVSTARFIRATVTAEICITSMRQTIASRRETRSVVVGAKGIVSV